MKCSNQSSVLQTTVRLKPAVILRERLSQTLFRCANPAKKLRPAQEQTNHALGRVPLGSYSKNIRLAASSTVPAPGLSAPWHPHCQNPAVCRGSDLSIPLLLPVLAAQVQRRVVEHLLRRGGQDSMQRDVLHSSIVPRKRQHGSCLGKHSRRSSHTTPHAPRILRNRC